ANRDGNGAVEHNDLCHDHAADHDDDGDHTIIWGFGASAAFNDEIRPTPCAGSLAARAWRWPNFNFALPLRFRSLTLWPAPESSAGRQPTPPGMPPDQVAPVPLPEPA